MLTSVTLSPTRFSTRLMTLRRTASAIWGIGLPYSTVMVRSTAASTVPTSTVTPRDWPPPAPPPVTLLKIPPIAWVVPPPIRTPSTSCAAMPEILETTLSSILVPPRSVWSGLPCCWVLCSLILPCSPFSKETCSALLPTLKECSSPLGRPPRDEPVQHQEDYGTQSRDQNRGQVEARHVGAAQAADYESSY